MPRLALLLAPVLAAACGGDPVDPSTTPTAPGAPVGLTVSAGDAQATLTFAAPTSSGSSAVTGYLASCATNGTSRSAEGTASPIAVTGLANGVTYGCAIAARNAAGLGPFAAAVSVTPAAPQTVPGSPGLTSATPGDASVVLAFTAPASNGGSPVTGYTAVCTPATGAVRSQGGTASPITVAGMTNGTSYDCAVGATNAIGTGILSSPIAATPAAVPGAPTGVSAIAGNASASLLFSPPASDGGAAVTSYAARCTPAAGGAIVASGPASPLTVTGLANGAAYGCTITATNRAGTGAASTAVSVTPVAAPTAPGAPQNVTATAGVNAITLAFAAPASTGGSAITGYVAACTAASTTTTAAASASPITVSGLSGGVTYSCAVTAQNAVGSSPASTAVTATPTNPATVPGAPTSVSATAGIASALVSFTAPASTGGAAITSYTVTCTAAGGTVTATGTASPITVQGLTNGVTYSCTVAATNSAGAGPASTAVTVTPSSGTSTTAGVLCSASGSGTSTFTGNAGPGGSYNYSVAYSYGWSCGASRVLAGNGVPSHNSTNGAFATQASAQSVNRTFTLTPSIVAANGTYLAQGVMAYALNSVKFDPATDGGCTNTATGTGQGQGCTAVGAMASPSTYPWNLEAIGGAFQFGTDGANAHTQPDGAYHYHGMPTTYLTQLGATSGRMTLVGWALDGFPIYARYGYATATDASSAIRTMTTSWQKQATPDAGRPSTATFPLGTFTQDYEYVANSGDLDQCNGRFGVTPEFPQGIYHYYVTDTFPFVQRCWKGR